MLIADLEVKVRELVGDVEHEGCSLKFTSDQVTVALNLAQSRMAELTHCTYQEIETALDDQGIIDFIEPTTLTQYGVMRVDRVDVDAPDMDPDATITVATTFDVADSPIIASVPEQAGASYFWSVAGGTLESGAITREVTIGATKAGKLFLRCSVCLNGGLAQEIKTITVTEE
jgi:hypothetical protein